MCLRKMEKAYFIDEMRFRKMEKAISSMKCTSANRKKAISSMKCTFANRGKPFHLCNTFPQKWKSLFQLCNTISQDEKRHFIFVTLCLDLDLASWLSCSLFDIHILLVSSLYYRFRYLHLSNSRLYRASSVPADCYFVHHFKKSKKIGRVAARCVV